MYFLNSHLLVILSQNITASKPAPVNTQKTEAAATVATTETKQAAPTETKKEEKADDFDDFINGLDL